MRYPELLVLRHGQTQWNLAGQYQGQKNSDLTALGAQQARDQGVILQGMGDLSAHACFTSPLGRTTQTAHLALSPMGMKAAPDGRLQEIGFGEWEGLTRLDIEHLWPNLAGEAQSKDWMFNAPGGENYELLRARVQSFLTDLESPAIIVTHGVTSLLLRGLWLGLTPADLLGLPHEQGCVYRLNEGQESCLRL